MAQSDSSYPAIGSLTVNNTTNNIKTDSIYFFNDGEDAFTTPFDTNTMSLTGLVHSAPASARTLFEFQVLISANGGRPTVAAVTFSDVVELGQIRYSFLNTDGTLRAEFVAVRTGVIDSLLTPFDFSALGLMSDGCILRITGSVFHDAAIDIGLDLSYDGGSGNIGLGGCSYLVAKDVIVTPAP